MRFNTLFTVSALSTALCSSALAEDMSYFFEAKYSILDGQATSYVNTASLTTDFITLSAGIYIDDVRVYAGYDPMRWKDAQADTVSLNVDYIGRFNNKDTSWYAGGGIGTMKYESDLFSESIRKTMPTVRTGLLYQMNDFAYLTAGLRYIYTNNMKIQHSTYLYSELENMFGVDFGFGVRF